jgi:hypothetical protein
VTRGLTDGELTLLEAAARFHRINGPAGSAGVR